MAAAAPRRPVALCLGGSFFPLHEGHLQIFSTARAALEADGRTDVVAAYLCPSHHAGLCRKFDGLADATSKEAMDALRTSEARKLLQASTAHREWVVWRTDAMDEPKNPGLAFTTAALKRQLGAEGTELVQVLGPDSKVAAVLRGKKHGEVVVVTDGRGVPPENEAVIRGHLVVASPEERPPMSSTILRWLHRAAYPAPAVPESFQLDWLTDTGRTLGAGRQGMVRLMRAGARFVAVKARFLDGKKREMTQFQREAQVWEHLGRAGSSAAPTLHATGVVGDGAIGYLVSDVGRPLCDLIPVVYPVWWRPEGQTRGTPTPPPTPPPSDTGAAALPTGTDTSASVPAAASESLDLPSFFERFRQFPVADDALPPELTFLRSPSSPQDKAAASGLQKQPAAEEERDGRPIYSTGASLASLAPGRGSAVPLATKAAAVKGLWRCLAQMRVAGAWHRDLKAENFVWMPDGTVRAIDFGVAKLRTDKTQLARGSCRVYPLVALDTSHYDDGCERYVLACGAVFDVMNEASLYATECGAAVSEAIERRRTGVRPSWRWRKLHDAELARAAGDPEIAAAAAFLAAQERGVDALIGQYEGVVGKAQCPNGSDAALPPDTQAAVALALEGTQAAGCADDNALAVTDGAALAAAQPAEELPEPPKKRKKTKSTRRAAVAKDDPYAEARGDWSADEPDLWADDDA